MRALRARVSILSVCVLAVLAASARGQAQSSSGAPPQGGGAEAGALGQGAQAWLSGDDAIGYSETAYFWAQNYSLSTSASRLTCY